MILSKGRATKKLPEAVEAHTARLLVKVEGAGHLWQIPQVYFVELQKMRDKSDVHGFPAVFAVHGSTLELYPTPDKKYRAVLRYCPAMKEI